MKSTPTNEEGLRERKRRETLQRIAEAGLKLFVTNGYDATTLETIAEAAGISRRTFFYYFKSKEDILLAWQGGLIQAIRDRPCWSSRRSIFRSMRLKMRC